ncbi:hypothetical protein EVAR_14041_1 [Eumeta japonica]|uniref:Uncharacterized protein n=1 Tax=Eumeta variegata TaxID=151549 RepID=A0A4C1UN37_EUMVA|nr:hypothetical protein EVAR_14041_1 [Eumeta japonica]
MVSTATRAGAFRRRPGAISRKSTASPAPPHLIRHYMALLRHKRRSGPRRAGARGECTPKWVCVDVLQRRVFPQLSHSSRETHLKPYTLSRTGSERPKADLNCTMITQKVAKTLRKDESRFELSPVDTKDDEWPVLSHSNGVEIVEFLAPLGEYIIRSHSAYWPGGSSKPEKGRSERRARDQKSERARPAPPRAAASYRSVKVHVAAPAHLPAHCSLGRRRARALHWFLCQFLVPNTILTDIL